MLGLLVAVAAVLGYAVSERRQVARSLLAGVFADAGVEALRFDIEEIGPTRLVAADVTIGTTDRIAVRRIEVAFSPGGLLRREVERLAVDGLDLTVRLNADGASVAPLDALPETPETAGGLLGWRIGRVDLAGARLRVIGPVGADLRVDGAIEPDTGDRHAGRLEFRGDLRPPTLEAIATTGTLAFEWSEDRLIRADLAVTGAGPRPPGIGAAAFDLAAVYDDGEAQIDVDLYRDDDRLAVSATVLVAAEDPSHVDGLHAAFDAAVSDLLLPGLDTALGLSGRGVIAGVPESLALVAETPLSLVIGSDADALTLRAAPSPEPLLTVDRTAGEGPSIGVRIAAADIAAGSVGGAIRDLHLTAHPGAVLRIAVERLHLVPRGLADWTAPVIVDAAGDFGDDVIGARRIVVTAGLEGDAAGRLGSIAIDGLAMALSLDAGGRIGGPLAPVLAATGGGAAVPPAPETVTLTDARLRITGLMPATLGVDGTVIRSDETGLTGTFDLRGAVQPPQVAPLAIAGPATFTLRSGRLHAATLSLGGRSVEGDEVALTGGHGPDGLTASLRFVSGEDRVTVDVSAPTLLGDPGGLAGARADFDLALDRVGVPGDLGRLSIVGSGRAAVAADGLSIIATSPLVLALTGDGDPLGLRISPSPESLLTAGPDPTRPERVGLRIAEGEATIGTATAVIRDLEADVTWPDRPRVALRRATVTTKALAGWAAPVALSGSAVLAVDAVTFQGRATTLGNRVRAAVSGRHTLETGRGEARLRFEPLEFQPGRLQPADLHAALGNTIAEVYGRVSVDGTLAWRPDRRASVRASIGAEDLSLSVGDVRLSDVDATINLTGVDPPTAPPGQQLRIARIALPTPLSDARARFALDRSGRIEIEEAAFRVLGGDVVVRGAVADPAAPHLTATLEVAGVDIQELLIAGGITAITASGRLAGRIPLTVTDTGFEIREAHLSAIDGGVIVYDAPAGGLGDAGGGGKLVAEALRNFRYDSLEMTVDGTSGGDWSATAVISGRNPDVLRGQPFQFNLDVGGDVEATVRGILFGYALRGEIQRRILERRR